MEEGRPGAEAIFVADIEATNEPEWVKRTIRAEDITGLAFIPLVAQGEVVGKFMTYYKEAHAFTRRETELAVTIARQVGFSLERSRAEAARRAAEAALRQSEERSRLMLENAPVMIWMSDAQGRCLHLNRILRVFLGRGGGWDRGLRLGEHHPPCRRARDREHDAGRRRAEGGGPHQGRYRNASGVYRVLVTDAQPRFAPSGEFLGMIGVNVDVTERDEAEQALRESEERFRLVVEAAPNGMVMSNAEGEIMLVNRQAERLFGYDRAELVGRQVELLVPERLRRGLTGLHQVAGERDETSVRAGCFRPGARTAASFPSRSVSTPSVRRRASLPSRPSWT